MLQGLVDQFRVTWRLMADPRVPVWNKAIPVLAVVYILSPFDFLPDFMPGIGQLDDIGLLLAGLKLFETIAPNQVVRELRERIG